MDVTEKAGIVMDAVARVLLTKYNAGVFPVRPITWIRKVKRLSGTDFECRYEVIVWLFGDPEEKRIVMVDLKPLIDNSVWRPIRAQEMKYDFPEIISSWKFDPHYGRPDKE